jgi:hypothetical protein
LVDSITLESLKHKDVVMTVKKARHQFRTASATGDYRYDSFHAINVEVANILDLGGDQTLYSFGFLCAK